jgi:hypothetical protein
MRTRFLVAALVLGSTLSLAAQGSPFLGKWDITATTPKATYPYWLEVRQENGQLVGLFQDRWGSVRKLPELAVVGEELVFSVGPPEDGAPKPVHRARVRNGKLVGELTTGAERVPWTGVRPPRWGAHDANAAHALGAPSVLFNGKDLSGWTFQFADEPPNFVVADGLLTNTKEGNNLVSQQAFGDFTLEMEYKLETNSNSGLYLRGRYELQVLDHAGKPPSLTGHMSVYGRVAPAVNASRPPGEWQAVRVTLVGNRLTVVLNGQTVQDNVAIEGTTGGALDSHEGAPGPVMVQGDHSKIWIRKLVVTPILTPRG